MRAASARAFLLLALALLAGASLAPLAVAQPAAADEEALRLYGCLDLLGGPDGSRHVAVPPTGAASRGATDGQPDCAGDRVFTEPAWLDADASPFYRSALSPRDQSVHPSLRYLPAAWFPAPGHGAGAVADPVDGTRGLFDTGTSGRGVPEYALAGGTPTALAVPSDGAPDLLPRHDGNAPNADLYFPALEFETRTQWHRGEDRPVSLPGGASFVLPFAPTGAGPGALGWETTGAARPTRWVPAPFGLGTSGDGAGAFALDAIAVAPGDVVSFLDHSVRVVEVHAGPQPRVVLEFRYEGNEVPEVTEEAVTLQLAADGAEDATLGAPVADAGNVVFAGRYGVARNPPQVPSAGAGPAGEVRPWFALLTSVEEEETGPRAQLTVGRLVSALSPWNLVIAQGALHRITLLDESSTGALRTFAFARLIPLGEAQTLPTIGVTLAAAAPRAAFPLPVPFAVSHVRLRTLDAPVHVDASGFLAAKDGTRRDPLGNRHVAPAAPFDAPRERTFTAPALSFSWRAMAVAGELVVSGAAHGGDEAHTVSALQPARFVELVLPSGRYRVESALLTPPPGAAHPASFLYEPGASGRLFADRAGNVRLAAGTAKHPDGGDWLLTDPALLAASTYPGLVRTPSEPAHGRVTLGLGYLPYHTWQAHGMGQVVVRDDAGRPVVDEAGGRSNNLHAVEPRNEEDSLGDVYGPAAVLRYRSAFLDRQTYEALAPPVGGGAQFLLPLASRNDGVPGLDSYDANGDDAPDPVLLAGWWVPGADGWRPEEAGVDVGTSPEPRGYLWLKSTAFALTAERDARFFDHGVRTKTAADGARVLDVLDLAALEDPRVLDTIPLDDLETPTCIAVRLDGSLDGPRDCGTMRPDAAGGGHLWWVEVHTAGATALVSMNRLAAPSDWSNPLDAGVFHVAGASYHWRFLETAAAAPGEERDRFGALTLEQVLPLGGDVHVSWRGEELRLVGVRTGELVPLAPPFSGTHERLRMFDVALDRDDAGFLHQEGASLARESASLRVVERAPLEVRFVARDVSAASRFVFLDATRSWGPERDGVAFVAGHFSGPPSWLPAPSPSPVRLDTDPVAGFPEAITDPDARGWDHGLIVGLPENGVFVVDTARLGGPGLVATWLDRARLTGSGNTQAAMLAHPLDTATNPLVARGSAWWRVSPAGANDLYVIAPIVRPPPPPPTPADPMDPPPAPGDGETPPGPGRGSPAPFAALLFVLAVMIRRVGRHRAREAVGRPAPRRP